MAAPGSWVARRLAAWRRRHPALDHALLTQGHYGAVHAGQQAGAITYYGFLSVFPILALSFFVVGYLSRVVPGADMNLVRAINHVLPGILGPGEGQLSLDDFRSAAGIVGLLGLAGGLFTGLGWLSATRDALAVVFELPARALPGFVVGKLRDLRALVAVGTLLFLAVAVSGFLRAASAEVLRWLSLSEQLAWLLWLVTLVFGLAANSALFYLLFRLLARPPTPRRSLWSGALLGAVGFEVLKTVSGWLLSLTRHQPSFQAFGIALILLVWIHYFSRVVLYAAAWAHTTSEAREQRLAAPADPVQGPQVPALRLGGSGPPPWLRGFLAGAVSAGGLVFARRGRRRS